MLGGGPGHGPFQSPLEGKETMNPNTQADLGKLVLRIALGMLVLLHGIA